MNRQQAKDLLPVIQAFAEGKTIEMKTSKGNWEVQENMSFVLAPQEYRVKPEPKYRPFENNEECWQEMLKHQPFGWIKGDFGYRIIYHASKNDNFKDMLEAYTFADGAPFGIKME